MAGLPNNTFAAPGVSFYATAGGGAASSLQSPAVIIPDGAGDAALVAQATGTGLASVEALGATGVGAVIVGSGASVYRMSVGNVGGPTSLEIGVNSAAAPAILYQGTGGALVLGDGGAGTVQTANTLVVFDESLVPGATNGVYIGPTSATTGLIQNTVATGGTLTLASSAAAGPLTLSDTGAGTGNVAVGGNGGPSIVLKGGNTTTSPNPSIVGGAVNYGTLQLGSDTIHPNILTLGVNVGGQVTVGGNGGVGITLEGGAGTTASIATTAVNTATLQVGPSGQYPNALTFTDLGVAGGVATVLNSATTTLNGLVRIPSSLSFQGSGFITAFLTLQTLGVVCGDNTTASIPNPAGLVAGLYLILARGGSAFCSVSAISYYNGATWSWGGGGCCPAFVTSPPSYIGIQGFGATLTLANGSGAGSVTMDFTYLQLGGNMFI